MKTSKRDRNRPYRITVISGTRWRTQITFWRSNEIPRIYHPSLASLTRITPFLRNAQISLGKGYIALTRYL